MEYEAKAAAKTASSTERRARMAVFTVILKWQRQANEPTRQPHRKRIGTKKTA